MRDELVSFEETLAHRTRSTDEADSGAPSGSTRVTYSGPRLFAALSVLTNTTKTSRH